MSIDTKKLTGLLKKNPSLAAASLAIFLLAMAFYFRFDQLDTYNDRLNDLKGNLNKLQRNITNSAQLERQLEEIKSINLKMEQAALRPSELARNLQYFYTLEAGNAVKLLDLRQQAVAASARGATLTLYAPITFSVNLAGDYDQLLTFTREVEKTFIGGKVLSASISPGSASDSQNPNKARLLSMVVQAVAITK